jgi:adenine phosphoribosyltransferase
MWEDARVKADELKGFIRDVPDFPKPGILFRDITPLLATPRAFTRAVDMLAERIQARGAEALVAIESRGFLFGAAVAARFDMPLLVVRKPGKLPYRTVGLDYALEYGTDRIEIHEDAVTAGATYALVDDLIATGGTAAATAELIEQQGGLVVSCAFVIELEGLGGRARLGARVVDSVLVY